MLIWASLQILTKQFEEVKNTIKVKNIVSTSYMSVGKKAGFKYSKIFLCPERTCIYIYFFK